MARPEERKFLGFSISNDGSERASRQRRSTNSRGGSETSHVGHGGSAATVDQRAEAIHRRMARLLRLRPDSAGPHNLEAWIRRRLRLYLWRQWRTRQNRFAELRRRGVAKFAAAVAAGSPTGALAHVRTSGGPASPTQRLFRVARSSPNLCARPSLTRSNRRGTGPVCPVVWEGWRREASPYPDQCPLSNLREIDLRWLAALPKAGPNDPFIPSSRSGSASLSLSDALPNLRLLICRRW